ncbi:MAG: radical SAM protein [Alphaproteobacteria bacterium]|jgi:hypothetical protein|nr:radical SAM protein [Alphaproteobacteria bacterium]
MAPRAVPGRPAAPVLDWIVFKVAQRCNLNCTYCYVYNRGDDSWKSRPKRASVDVTDQLARRIREHCEAFALTDFTVELHGGEPLLLGKPRMRDLLERLHLGVGPAISLKIVMQTNGLLLDHEWLELLAYYGVTFGLSLDGPPDIADRRRVTLDGRGSTEPLLRRIADLRSRSDYFDALNSGVLCVLDPDADGRALVEWFADNGFRGLDFLLPDGNWENPPQDWRGSDTYAPVLLSAFDAWLGLGDRAPRIRIFDVMMMADGRPAPSRRLRRRPARAVRGRIRRRHRGRRHDPDLRRAVLARHPQHLRPSARQPCRVLRARGAAAAERHLPGLFRLCRLPRRLPAPPVRPRVVRSSVDPLRRPVPTHRTDGRDPGHAPAEECRPRRIGGPRSCDRWAI